MAKPSRIVLALGVAVLLAGVLFSYAALRGGDDAPSGPQRATVTVVVAARAIPAGTTGANALAQGAVTQQAVAPDARPAQAFADTAALEGRIAIAEIAQGEVLTEEQFGKAQTSIGTVRIPPGKTALALEMSNVPGVAGFAGAGDNVDVYGVAKQGAEGGTGAEARLVLQGVEVLNVNGTLLAPTQGQPGGPGLVFLLALTPEDAAKVIYLKSFEQLYFALTPKGHVPVTPAPSIGPDDVLAAA